MLVFGLTLYSPVQLLQEHPLSFMQSTSAARAQATEVRKTTRIINRWNFIMCFSCCLSVGDYLLVGDDQRKWLFHHEVSEMS